MIAYDADVERNLKVRASRGRFAAALIELIEADVQRSIIGRNVRIEAGAHIEDSIIFDHTHIGSGARLHRVVVDRQNEIQAGSELGGGDDETKLPVAWTDSGVAVLPKPLAPHAARKRRYSPH